MSVEDCCTICQAELPVVKNIGKNSMEFYIGGLRFDGWRCDQCAHADKRLCAATLIERGRCGRDQCHFACFCIKQMGLLFLVLNSDVLSIIRTICLALFNRQPWCSHRTRYVCDEESKKAVNTDMAVRPLTTRFLMTDDQWSLYKRIVAPVTK
jgi:hypothetical protein